MTFLVRPSDLEADSISTSNSAFIYFDDGGAGGKEFYIQSGSSPTKWLRMDTTGAIGIGSNDPATWTGFGGT